MQRSQRDLGIDIDIPGQDAAVPIPAEQRAVRKPGLDVELAAYRQVGPHQVPQRRCVLLVAQLAAEEPLVVVPQRVGAPRFAVVLLRVHLDFEEAVVLLLLLVAGLLLVVVDLAMSMIVVLFGGGEEGGTEG